MAGYFLGETMPRLRSETSTQGRNMAETHAL